MFFPIGSIGFLKTLMSVSFSSINDDSKSFANSFNREFSSSNAYKINNGDIYDFYNNCDVN